MVNISVVSVLTKVDFEKLSNKKDYNFLGTILLIINYVTNPITTLLQALILLEYKLQQIYLL